jgi:hypothetical protein
MTPQARELVRSRANHQCEYCRLPQSAVPFAPFHIEHIVAKQHGGTDEPDNLALACDRCNAFKGPNLSTIDAATRHVVQIFNPRTQDWSKHFRQVGYNIEGITDIGKATVALLNMNATRRVQLRTSMRIQLSAD